VSLTNSNFGNGVGIFCDGSGNFYISGQGFDSTGTYSALYWVKLTSSFTITASKSFYIANSSWKFVSDGVPAQGGDYSLSTCLYYSGASPSEVLFITVNSSGTAVNSYSFQPSTGATIYGSKTADAYGNTYTLLNGTSGYIVAQNSSGTVLWQNSVTGFGFNTGGSGYLLTDGVSLWVSNGNAGSSHVGSFSALTGSLKWAKAYSSLTNYEFQCGTFSSGNPVFAGSSNAGAVSNFTSPTASTGNTNGTYGGNTVSTVTPTVTASSITATSQTIASSTFSNSAPTTTTGVTLYAYTFASTNGASMTI